MYFNSPQRAWSLVSPLPVVVYLKNYDEYVVFWNGFLLSHAHALQLMLVPYGIYASPEIRRAVTDTFFTLYSSGAFSDVNWDKSVHENYYNQVNYFLNQHITTFTQNKTLPEAVKFLSTTDCTVV